MLVLNNIALSNYILMFSKGDETPDSRVENVKNTLVEYGGSITHEFSGPFRGFSFAFPEPLITTLQYEIQNAQYPVVIEKDSAVGVWPWSKLAIYAAIIQLVISLAVTVLIELA